MTNTETLIEELAREKRVSTLLFDPLSKRALPRYADQIETEVLHDQGICEPAISI